MTGEITVTRKVHYLLDANGHFLSQTPCPFWRMYHNPINDDAIYVGSSACNCCRWFMSKNPEEMSIECNIPQRLVDRYDREHQRLEKRLANYRRAILKAIEEDANKQQSVNRLYGGVKKERGFVYEEHYNKGNQRHGWRYVAEITIGQYRYRMRSANYEKCWAWINNIREIYRAVRNNNKYMKLPEANDEAVVRLAKLGLFGKILYEGRTKETRERTMRLKTRVAQIAEKLNITTTT